MRLDPDELSHGKPLGLFLEGAQPIGRSDSQEQRHAELQQLSFPGGLPPRDHVVVYIEQHSGSAATIKQHMARVDS
jgi:hypothetical protein